MTPIVVGRTFDRSPGLCIGVFVRSWISVFLALPMLCASALAQAPARPSAPTPTASAPAPASVGPVPAAPPAAVAPTPAAAVAPPPEPTAAQRDAAREAYTRGQALFAEGKYVEAKAAFAAAFATVPNPIVLLGSAECELRLGLLEDGYASFQRYLSMRPDAPDRASVEQKIADLLAMQATLVITSQPPGAAIKVDGQDSGKVTPAELPLTRGDHTLEFSLPGYQKASDTIAARIGARLELEVALQPVPPPPPVKVAPVVHVAAKKQPPTTALWLTGVTGAVGLVTGTVLGFLVLTERSDFDAKPTAAAADRGERLALFADVAFGVGAMALITGAVLYLTSDDPDPSPAAEHAQRQRFQIAPTALANGGGVTARMKF